MNLSKNATFLLNDRYCRKGENIDGLFDRVAKALSSNLVQKKWLKNAMLNGYFLPASPTLRNAGMPNALLHPCHVLPITDSISGIMKCLARAATVFHHGGGVG